ncbi:MAG TPA: arsenic transporter [Candidatus Ignatzschineria merdigallinarum]|uniref:Arsenical pump membrane protein n=1 Tax=Candidatus Ignatzschineria merdigallinarum TaxID=2838621 RepID=A0A9D1Q5V5_9GAMM|nr:arsenic transporter [Candidatus Ignatzschineria merdigallinarum]
MILALIIFILTITLVIWQPKGLGIGYSATLGAVIALIFGVIEFADIATVWAIIWNAVLTFIAIIIISILLDEAGFFKWAALHIAHFGKGSGHRLFFLMIMLGALISAFFANDGAALILTPIVMAILVQLGVSRASTLAFVMGAGLIADTASLPLTVSNLVNIVSADYYSISFGRYASVMIPVNLISIMMTLLVLYLFFRRDLAFQYDAKKVFEAGSPAMAIQDKSTFIAGWAILLCILIGFFVSDLLHLPISTIAGMGAVVLLLIARRGKVINVKKVIMSAPWQIVIFALGMYLVVFGLRNAGIMDYLVLLLNRLAEEGIWSATIGTGFISAGLSSIMNNLPTVLIGVLSVDASSATDLTKEAMVYANVIGSDLGPKITPIGSLATLLWLHVLATKNMKISWGYYFRVGIVLTVPVLFVTLVALVVRLI